MRLHVSVSTRIFYNVCDLVSTDTAAGMMDVCTGAGFDKPKPHCIAMYKYIGGGGGGWVLIHKKQNNKRLYDTYICSVLFIICSLFVNIFFSVPYSSLQHQRNGRRLPIDSKNGGISLTAWVL